MVQKTPYTPDRTVKPFASFHLYSCADATLTTPALRIAALERYARASLKNKMKALPRCAIWQEGATSLQAFAVEEKAQPSWLPGGALTDKYHHLFVLLHYDGYLGLVATDSAARALAINAIESSLKFSRIDESALENAFVNGSVLRALWLRGAHRKNQRKADSKVLFGPKLESALNPMDDRTFQSSSVRAEPYTPVAGTKQRVVGVTPASSYLWVGPTRDAGDLALRFSEVVDHLKASETTARAAVPILAKPIHAAPAPGAVSEAFDFSFVEAESVDAGSEERPLLEQWEQALDIATVAVPGQDKFELAIADRDHPGSWRVEVAIDQWMDTLATTVTPSAGTATWPRWNDFRGMLGKAWAWSVWFESGHALVNGTLSWSDMTIADFDGACAADFTGYQIDTEKPVKLDGSGEKTKSIDFALVGKDGSLCSWWVNGGALQLYPQLRTMAANDFALVVCDDGAGEVADFVMFAHHDCFKTLSNPSKLAIIQVHLKAAGKLNPAPTKNGAPRKRELAPKKFEEVLEQAVKNLAHVRMPALSAAFGSALIEGKNPLWEAQSGTFQLSLAHGNKLGKAAPELQKLGTFNGQRYHKHVIVVQPHQSLALFEAEMGRNPPQAAMRLLCTMLNTADGACRADSAQFKVVFSP